MSTSHRTYLIVGFVASSLTAGCTKTRIVAMVIPPSVPTKTALPVAPTTAMPPATDKFVSSQDPGLVVSEISDRGSRIGRVVEGYIINRGTRDYGIVHLRMDFLDAHGAVLGHGSDFTQQFSPGSQRYFNINMTTDSVRYKITELSGY